MLYPCLWSKVLPQGKGEGKKEREEEGEMENHWKVSTNYVRAQRNKADITLWEDQSVLIAKNIKYGDANLIVRAVNSYKDLLEACEELINAREYVLKNGGDILTSSSW